MRKLRGVNRRGSGRLGLVAGVLLLLAPAPIAAEAGTPPTSQQGGPTAAAAYGWGRPTWSDEFSGSRLDRDWAVYNSVGHAGNGVRRPSQVHVGDGMLTQTGTAGARSAGMVLDDHFHRYGRWETRLRTTEQQRDGRAYHPVSALIPGGDQEYHCGATDVDYAEYDVGEPVYFFAHNLPNRQDYTRIELDSTRWHAFAVEITPEHMSWFVDGRVVMTDTRPGIVSGVALAVNFQLDAYYPDGLNPATLQVDWTRYYPLRGAADPVPAPPPSAGVYAGAC